MINGFLNVEELKFDFLFDEQSFEIIMIPTSPNSFSIKLIGKYYDTFLKGRICSSDKIIVFRGINIFKQTFSKSYGKVDYFMIYYPNGSSTKVSQTEIFFRGECVDYVSVISRATKYDIYTKTLSVTPISDFSFSFSISESEMVNFAYELHSFTNNGSKNNKLYCIGLETLVIYKKEVSDTDVFDYYLKILRSNQILSNSINASFEKVDFDMVGHNGEPYHGEIYSRFKNNKEIKPNYHIVDFDNYKCGIEAVTKTVFADSFKYITFLRDENGDCFSYERQFKLFSAFDHYYGLNCSNISYSEPDSMTQLKNDLIKLMEDNKDVIANNKKKKDYYKSLKGAINNYDNSMSTIINSLLFNNFFSDEERAANYSRKMNDYRNGIVHGHDMIKVSEQEELKLDEVSYWDFVIYERLLLFVALFDYKDKFDLPLFCKQLYAL